LRYQGAAGGDIGKRCLLARGVDDDDTAGTQLAGDLDGITEQRLAGQGLEDLGHRGSHPRALPGCEDDHQQVGGGCARLPPRLCGLAVFGHQSGEV
jgi:hypothetical protein